MARRRKRNTKKRQNEGFIFPAPFAVILLMVGMLALGYLWVSGRCEALGRRIKVLEVERTAVRERRYNEESKWANLRSPRNIKTALHRHGLVMTWPDKSRVVELPLSMCRAVEVMADYDSALIQVAMND